MPPIFTEYALPDPKLFAQAVESLHVTPNSPEEKVWADTLLTLTTSDPNLQNLFSRGGLEISRHAGALLAACYDEAIKPDANLLAYALTMASSPAHVAITHCHIQALVAYLIIGWRIHEAYQRLLDLQSLQSLEP